MSAAKWMIRGAAVGGLSILLNETRKNRHFHYSKHENGTCFIDRSVPISLHGGKLLFTDIVRCYPDVEHQTGLATRKVFVIIPGNPGLVDFYWTMCQRIFDAYGGKCWVLCIGHAGHSHQSSLNDDLISYEDQIECKEALLRRELPWIAEADVSVTLSGHSVGSRICLELMKRMAHVEFHSFYGLCPTVIDIADSANGRALTPKLTSITFRRFAAIAVQILQFILGFLPKAMQVLIARTIMQRNGETADDYFVEIALRLVSPHLVRNSLDMADGEIRRIRDAGQFKDVIEKYGSRITFLLSPIDKWCDEPTVAKMRIEFPQANFLYLSSSLPHAFVLQHRHLEEVTDAKLCHHSTLEI